MAATALAVFVGAMAEGYQINTLSARQLGMGHTGIGMKLGAESMFFNPGALGYMDKTIDVSASVTALMPTCTATLPDGKEYTTDNGVSTPIFVNAAFSIYKNLKAGLSFYTPYGSAINWTDNWPGAVLNQSVSLKTFTLQPTISWAINDYVSVGAGLMVTWGSENLNKGLVSAETADKLIDIIEMMDPTGEPLERYGNTPPASVNLNGKTKIAVGVNVGVLVNPIKDLSIGVSYRSKMGMRVKAGNATVTYNGGVLEPELRKTLDDIHTSQFTSEMPCPWVLGFGASYTGIDKLTLAFDARLTGWHTYKSLDVEFLNDRAKPYNQYITKAYKNSWCFSLGAQYAVTERFDARLGLMVDKTPVNDLYYNPETPGMSKVEPTIGFSFRPIPALSVDFSFMYIHGCGTKNASITYADLLYKPAVDMATGAIMAQGVPAEVAAQMAPAAVANMGVTPEKRFTADYRLHAVAPSIGIRYTF